MGKKLGKKARKFARKNLQSVMKKKRKTNAVLNKRRSSSSKGQHGSAENLIVDATGPANIRDLVNGNIEECSLSVISSEDDFYPGEDISDSDGYLSEDPCLRSAQCENESNLEESMLGSALSSKNQKIALKLAKRKEKLESLKKKDPKFEEFLSDHVKGLDSLLKKMYSDEEDGSDQDAELINGDLSQSDHQRSLTTSTIKSWSEKTTQPHNLTALPSLLNAYRAACQYGAESSGDSVLSSRLQDSDTCVSIITFMLQESDSIFRRQLGLLSTNNKKETISRLENNSKWKALKPMIKSYLLSTIFFLNQLAEIDLLIYSLSRLRASIIFFAAFPSLLRKLLQFAVNLWMASCGTVSSCAFRIIYDVASFAPEHYENCLKKVYKAFIARCRGSGSANLNHINSLRESCVELCSIDLQKSVGLALLSVKKLTKIFQLGLRTKKEEVLKKICSWECMLCLELWVKFISANIGGNYLNGLLYPMIQLINGIVYLFPGARYLPLRVMCIQLLNQLSSASEIFIPVSRLILDILDFNTGKEIGKSEKIADAPTSLKLPKNMLKSQKFQEECIFAVVELLSTHFDQWSYHISFPELATIPLINLRKFLEKSTVETLRQMLKRLIDQVEKNVDFIQTKRNEVSFGPRDQGSVDSFLQSEKGSSNTSFTQFYKSVMQKAIARSQINEDEKSLVEQKKPVKRKRQLPKGAANGEASIISSSVQGEVLRPCNSEHRVKNKRRKA
ncbi:hypothetical protein Droror1_Dr00017324 [Drosera rotundifolia]